MPGRLSTQLNLVTLGLTSLSAIVLWAVALLVLFEVDGGIDRSLVKDALPALGVSFLGSLAGVALLRVVIGGHLCTLRQLEEHCKRRDTERLGVSLKPQSKRSDELGLLARTLTEMEQELDEQEAALRLHARSLSDEVMQRTRELEEAHDELLELDADRSAVLLTVARRFDEPVQAMLGSVSEGRVLDAESLDTVEAACGALEEAVEQLAGD